MLCPPVPPYMLQSDLELRDTEGISRENPFVKTPFFNLITKKNYLSKALDYISNTLCCVDQIGRTITYNQWHAGGGPKCFKEGAGPKNIKFSVEISFFCTSSDESEF